MEKVTVYKSYDRWYLIKYHDSKVYLTWCPNPGATILATFGIEILTKEDKREFTVDLWQGDQHKEILQVTPTPTFGRSTLKEILQAHYAHEICDLLFLVDFWGTAQEKDFEKGLLSFN